MSLVARNLILLHANNKDTDKPAHPHSLVSTFVICSLQRFKILTQVKINKIFERKIIIFSYPSVLTYIWGAQKNRLIETACSKEPSH